MPMIDADCHVIETEQTWAFMDEGEAKFRPHYLTSTEGKQFVGIDGKLRAPTFGGEVAVAADDPRETLSGRVQTTVGSRTMKDIEGRLRHMDELGIDISGQHAKTLEGFMGQRWDILIPVCEEACEACPWVPGAKRVERWMFDDPSASSGNEAARLAEFRRIRDEIAAAVRDLIARS